MSNVYKILTDEDILALNLPEKELKRIDEGLTELIEKNLTESAEKRSCCKVCECAGYWQGNPSTVCRRCGHDWQQHRC